MLLCAEPTASFPAKIGAKSGMLTIRIYNSRDQQTPPEAVSLLVNGCAAHDWGQVLTFEGKNGPHFRAFTSNLTEGLTGKCPEGSTDLAPMLEFLAQGSKAPERL